MQQPMEFMGEHKCKMRRPHRRLSGFSRQGFECAIKREHFELVLNGCAHNSIVEESRLNRGGDTRIDCG